MNKTKDVETWRVSTIGAAVQAWIKSGNRTLVTLGDVVAELNAQSTALQNAREALEEARVLLEEIATWVPAEPMPSRIRSWFIRYRALRSGSDDQPARG